VTRVPFENHIFKFDSQLNALLQSCKVHDPRAGGDIFRQMSQALELRQHPVDAIYLLFEQQAVPGNLTERKFWARFAQRCSPSCCGECIS
jgi:hypothetical protein